MIVPRFLLAAFALVTAAQATPIRVLCIDASGTDTTALHNAMRDLGRDAIWFDYAKEKVDAPYDLTLTPSELSEKPDPSELKAHILSKLSPERRAAHEAFLAQREPEKREAHPQVANYEKRSEPLTFQQPFSVNGSMDRTQVPADLEVKLFAAGPAIAKPIAFA